MVDSAAILDRYKTKHKFRTYALTAQLSWTDIGQHSNSVRFKDSTIIQDIYRPAQQSRFKCRTAQKSKADKRQQQRSNPGQIQDSTATLDICKTAKQSRTDKRQQSNPEQIKDSKAIKNMCKTAQEFGTDTWQDNN
jgi:hypothetical protein